MAKQLCMTNYDPKTIQRSLALPKNNGKISNDDFIKRTRSRIDDELERSVNHNEEKVSSKIIETIKNPNECWK